MTDVSIREIARRKALRRAQSKRRRDKLRRKKLCINGARHGKSVARERCRWCNAVDAHGLAGLLRLEAEGKAPARPAGYRPKPRHTTEQLQMARAVDEYDHEVDDDDF